MTNRIGGDFDSRAVEAFRAAYAAQLESPEDLEVDELTGLPTDTVSNTSPWYSHVGLWKYPSGKGPEDDLKEPFVPDDYISDPYDDEEDDIDSLLAELFEDDDDYDWDGSYDEYEDYEDEEDDLEELTDEEIDEQIAMLLAED